MYVCICNAINCRQVRRALDDGARSVAQVFQSADKRPVCGQCVPTMRDMIGERCAAEAESGFALAAE